MISGALSIGCIVGASTVHVKRNAALATAYQLAANTLSDYKEKVIETIGEEREKEVQKKVDAKKVEKLILLSHLLYVRESPYVSNPYQVGHLKWI